MESLLQIVASIVLVVLFIALGLYFYFRTISRNDDGCTLSDDLPPVQIRLVEQNQPEWLEDEEVKGLSEELKSLGFDGGKVYEVVEIAGMRLRAFVKPNFLAILTAHPTRGYWVDVIAQTEDGVGYTLSNSPTGGEIETAENAEKYYLIGLSATELYHKVVDMTSGKRYVPLEQKEFKEFFENSYKEEMYWKNQNGGYTPDDFARILGQCDAQMSPRQRDEAWVEIKTKELHNWGNIAIKELQEVQNIDPTNKLFIVPLKGDTIAFIRYLGDVGLINETKAYEKVYKDEKNLAELFEKIYEGLPYEKRPIKSWDGDYPVTAMMYELTHAASPNKS